MAKKLSGMRYAQAIFDLALENNQAEQWGEDLSVVAEVFENADFAALMKHANMPAADKLAATATVLAGVNLLVRNLVDLLIAKKLGGRHSRRLFQLHGISRQSSRAATG